MQRKHRFFEKYLMSHIFQSQETVRDLEDQLQTLKHALQDSDQQRTRELRVSDPTLIF